MRDRKQIAEVWFRMVREAGSIAVLLDLSFSFETGLQAAT